MTTTPRSLALAFAFVWAFSGSSSFALAGQWPPPTDPPVPGAPPPAAADAPCVDAGQVLGPVDFGVEAGQPVADGSAVLLDDGRVRFYVFGQGKGIVSAVSTGTDGLAFVAEEGTRMADGHGMPRAVRLTDGRWRLFFTTGGGIGSATSDDGLTFTREPDMRITAEAAGFSSETAAGGQTSGATVIALPDGGYRMYFSDLPRPGDPPGHHAIKSAVSTDMLAWTVEDGVRLGPAALALTESAEHPSVLAHEDGSVTLYYGKFEGPGFAGVEGLYQSTSVDGLTFEEERYTGLSMGNDPDALRLPDGTLLVYYGQFDHEIGGTIRVARCTPTPAAPAPTPEKAKRSR